MQIILLVDSPDGDALLLASALRVEGFQVELTGRAAEARAVLAREPVALALVDLMLRTDPATNGLELARELKLSYPLMRMLLTSPYYLSERQLERADCGVSGFIPKPYEVGDVVRFIVQKVSGPPSTRRAWRGEPSSGIVTIPERVATTAAPTLLPAAGDRARR